MAIYNKDTTFSVDTPTWKATGKEPKPSLKKTGFVAGFKPPAAYFNWFWNRVCRNLSEIKSKISDLWSFITATDFLIYEEVEGGIFESTNSIKHLYTSGSYQGKQKYILTGTIGIELADELGVTAGVMCEVSNRYGSYTIYVPSIDKLFTYTNIVGNRYRWDNHQIGTDNIADSSITLDKLSEEVLALIQK